MGKEDLLQAVKDGNVQFVRKALHKHHRSSRKKPGRKTFINQPDAEGFTALHYAALSGDVEVVSALIQMEADPNARDQKGMTPLHLGAWAGKEGSLKLLLENRALANLPAFSGDTALHLAAQHGYSGCAKILLAWHADGCFRNGFWETPLDLAAQYGHTAVVKQFLTNEAVVDMITSPVIDTRCKSPLHLAAKSGHDDIVHYLLQGGANVNEERAEGTPLHVAALYGKTDVVKLLIRAGADVSKTNNNGLMALDVVNKFTTSRAGLEIKQLLRETAGEHITYAKAICEYNNPGLENSISFKVNDCVAVIEQNADGCWKGYVVNQEHEKVGFFPSMTVQLMMNSKKTHSVSSIGSQDSSGGRSGTSSTTPEKRSGQVSPKTKPVGVVPVGQFEVVALSQSEPDTYSFPKQTANGGFAPRMSSFKQKNSAIPQVFQKPIQRVQSAGRDGQSYTTLKRTLSAEEKSLPSIPVHQNDTTQLQQTGHPAPSQNHTQGLATHKPMRAMSEKHSPVYNGQTLNRHTNINSLLEATSSPRHRTASAGSTRQEIAQKIHQSLRNRQQQPSIGSFSDTSSSSGVYPPTSNTVVNYTPTSGSLVNYSLPKSRESSSYSGRATYVSSSQQTNGYATPVKTSFSHSPRHSGGASYASLQVTPSPTSKQPSYQPTEYTSVFISDQSSNENFIENDTVYENLPSPRVKLKPILSNSSRSSSIRSESSIDSSTDSRPKQNNVTFANTNDKQNNTNRTNYEIMTSLSFENSNSEPVPMLPLKRSNTLPVRQSNGRMGNSPTRLQGLYENVISNNDIEDGRLMRTNDDVFVLDQKLSKDEQEVMRWLAELKLASYFDNFKAHGFDMVSMRAITPEDLNLLDISKTGHRKKLLSEVAKLPPTNRVPVDKPRDVGSWLGELNLRQYEPNFIEGGFDDIDFIKDLDRNDLEMIDIKKKGHQKKILLAVRALNELELTAILDRAVAESPVKRASSIRKQNGINEFFSSNTPEYTMTSVSLPLSPRDNLPPPSGQEQIIRQTSPSHPNPPVVAKKPVGKKPVPTPTTKPKPAQKNAGGNLGTSIKPVHSQVNGVPNNVGKVSMKPPGVIQGDQEEVVTSSKSRDFFKQQERNVSNGHETSDTRLRNASTSSTSSTSSDSRARDFGLSNSISEAGVVQGSQDEQVTSSKSRDFFKKQEGKISNQMNSDVISSSRQRTVSSSSESSISSDTRLRAPPAPKPKPILSSPSVETPNHSLTEKSKKPPPPPAPPRMSSMTKESACIALPSSPKPEGPKSTDASYQLQDFLPPPPVMPPPDLDDEESFLPPPPPPEDMTEQTEVGGVQKMTIGTSLTSPEDLALQAEIDALEKANTEYLQSIPSTVPVDDEPSKETKSGSRDEVQTTLGETDDILADIMADISDFSAQLDNMF